MAKLLFGRDAFLSGMAERSQASLNPDYRDHYVQKEESCKVVCVPDLINVLVRNAPGLSIRPGRSHENKVNHIYQTWYTTTFYDSSRWT